MKAMLKFIRKFYEQMNCYGEYVRTDILAMPKKRVIRALQILVRISLAISVNTRAFTVLELVVNRNALRL